MAVGLPPLLRRAPGPAASTGVQVPRLPASASAVEPRILIDGARQLLAALKIMRTAYTLLLQKKTVTQRECFYLHTALFKCQAEANAAIAAACSLLRLPRHALGIFAAARGWYTGAVIVHELGADGSTDAATAAAIAAGTRKPASVPADALTGALRVTNAGARFILIVEKDSIFRRLDEDGFWCAPGSECVLVTGCGMPDLATRAFVAALHESLGLPVYHLGDWGPYGLGIALVYAYGAQSKPKGVGRRGGGGGGGAGGAGGAGGVTMGGSGGKSSSAGSSYVPLIAFDEDEDGGGDGGVGWGGSEGGVTPPVPVRWLGVTSHDLQEHDVPDRVLLRCSTRDDERARGLQRHPAVLSNEALQAEVACFLEGGRKMDIEGLLAGGRLDYLAGVYLPAKLAAGDYIEL